MEFPLFIQQRTTQNCAANLKGSISGGVFYGYANSFTKPYVFFN